MEYRLADETGSPWSVIVSHTQDGPHETSAAYHDSYTYVDGRGETLAVLSEADPDPQVGDGHNWIVGEVVDRDAKGAVVRKYLATVYDGDPLSYDAASRPQVDFAEVWYDAFGRDVKTTTLDGSVATQTRYHAVGADVWDAEDVGPGDHQGTYASVTKDGHGRVIRSTERAKEGSAIELRHVDTEYLSTGEPKTIARRRGNESIVRTMQYDSFGRMTVNNDPNTSANGKSWRYLYDAAGRLVATSDARGCGVNYRYDAGGRLISEDYSPCESHHAPYNAAPEVTYLYDVPGEEAFIGRPQAYTLGRMTEVTGLGAKSVFRYDARGRKIEVAKQVAAPQGGFAADQWFRKSALYDAADRAVNETTGAVVNVESSQVSSVVTSYTRRGTTRRVDSAYGLLVDHVRRAADGLVTEIQYGDAANTTTAFSHDRLRRLQNLMTYRAHAPTWAGAGVDAKSTQQLLLQDEDYTYDRVGNPIEIRDLRTPEEWPEGAKPAHRQMQYDDLYRLSRVGYEYPSGTDTWKDPYAAEVSDNTREQPSQRADFAGGNRPLRQTFAYDWLGNLVSSGDDTDTFYDRSLGEMTHGASKPYQLKHAANAAGSARSGHLDATYDAAGNMKSLVVHRAGKCIPTVGDGKCRDQRFEYEWDEIGRLVRARRFDAPNGLSLPPPSTATPAAQLDYAYDASGDRVRKTVVDTATQGERHTIYLFSSLELRLARYSSEGYEVNEQTEVPYLTLQGVRLARVVHASEPGTLTASTRVFLELGDHLGTTSVVLDRATGELVERSTAYAYGAPESDYRPGRWGEFRENYRFTGKEDDVEVGLIYFGKRYYAPLLQRWISADPLAVHSPGAADLNLYAYVHGRVLVAVDPVGLAGVGDEPKMEAVIQQNLFPNSTAARADPVPSPQGPNVVTEAQSANEMWRIARSLPTPSALACPHNEGVRLSAAGEADPSYRNHMYLRNQLVLPSMKALELNLTALALVQGAAAGPLAAGALGIGEAGSVAAAPRLALSAAGLRPEGAPLRLTEPSIGKAAAAAPAARTLTDPGLAQFVRRLEAAGIRATGANISMVGEGGRVLGEIDVVTQNALIQFKNGPSSARAVIDQVTLRTEPFVSRPVITFINDAGRAGTRTVNGAGGRILITNDFATLVDVLR
jgi:RHS repeat-associated protein